MLTVLFLRGNNMITQTTAWRTSSGNLYADKLVAEANEAYEEFLTWYDNDPEFHGVEAKELIAWLRANRDRIRLVIGPENG